MTVKVSNKMFYATPTNEEWDWNTNLAISFSAAYYDVSTYNSPNKSVRILMLSRQNRHWNENSINHKTPTLHQLPLTNFWNEICGVVINNTE